MKKLNLFLVLVIFSMPLDIFGQETCTCEDIMQVISFGELQEYNDDCCVIPIDVSEIKCVFDYQITFGGVLHTRVYDPNSSVDGFLPTACFGEPGYYGIWANGELCVEQTFGCTPCEMIDCELSLSVVNDCQLRVCAMGDCAAPNSFLLERPDGSTSSWSIAPGFKPCRLIDIELDGEYCVTLTDAQGCEYTDCIEIEGCDDCNCNITTLTVSDCHIRACVSDFMTECAGPLTYQWESPSGLSPIGQITNPVSFVTCSGIDALEDGTYCVTLTDANGCTSSDCIEIQECYQCEPQWVYDPTPNTGINIQCSSLSGNPGISLSMNENVFCNECCWEEDDTSIDWVVEYTLVNVTKGITFYERKHEFTRDMCYQSGAGMGTGGYWSNCEEVDIGDVLMGSWSLTFSNWVDCEYSGPNPIIGSVSHTVTSQDLGNCCM